MKPLFFQFPFFGFKVGGIFQLMGGKEIPFIYESSVMPWMNGCFECMTSMRRFAGMVQGAHPIPRHADNYWSKLLNVYEPMFTE